MALLDSYTVAHINSRIRSALTRYGQTPGAIAQEPYLVAAIFRDQQVVDALVQGLGAAGFRARVYSVFTHVRPKVRFNCPAERRCELGDAMVLYREQLAPGHRRRQALVFQAKEWDASRRLVKTDSDQWSLYRYWPTFSIIGGARNIVLGPGDHGRMLGLGKKLSPAANPRVSRRISTVPGCALHHPSPSIGLDRTLGRVLAGLMRFSSGERVDNEWARLAWHILRNVFPRCPGKTYPVGNRGVASRYVARIDDGMDILLCLDGPPKPPVSAADVEGDGFVAVVIDAAAGEQ